MVFSIAKTSILLSFKPNMMLLRKLRKIKSLQQKLMKLERQKEESLEKRERRTKLWKTLNSKLKIQLFSRVRLLHAFPLILLTIMVTIPRKLMLELQVVKFCKCTMYCRRLTINILKVLKITCKRN